MADPTSDMLIRIKNAYRAGHESVQIPYSKFKYEIAKAMERSGFIGKIERKGKRTRKILDIILFYPEGNPALGDIKLISKPSRRLYAGHKEMHKAKQGGTIILSTPQGIMSNQEARKARVGGELIAEMW